MESIEELETTNPNLKELTGQLRYVANEIGRLADAEFDRGFVAGQATANYVYPLSSRTQEEFDELAAEEEADYTPGQRMYGVVPVEKDES